MLPWLGQTARDMRRSAGRKQIQVAAALGRDQSVIGRFEQARGWPQDIDEVIAAYAEDLDVEPYAIWAEALARWRDARC